MTLNQLAASIANQLRQPFNHELQERIKDLFKEEMALYIRRSIKEHGIDDGLKLSYTAKLKYVNELNDPVEDDKNKAKLLRTQFRIPTPVRIKNDSPFTFVGTANRRIGIAKRNVREHTLMHSFSSTGISFSYDYINGHIYVYDHKDNTYKSKYIVIESIFESPEEVLSIYEDVDGQDIQLPMPADIIAIARDKILQRVGSIPQKDISVEQNNMEQ